MLAWHLGGVPLALAAAAPVNSASSKAGEFDKGGVSFAVRVAGVESTYRVFGFYIMPGETVEVAARSTGAAGAFRLEGGIEVRPLGAVGAARWRFDAPATPGLYPMTVIREPGGESMLLNIFVVRPLSEARDGKLGDYRIGEYPEAPLRGNPIYLPPRGLVEVTPAQVRTAVSPHFTLGQFLCKQEAASPSTW